MMILLYALVGFNRLDLLLMLFPAMAYAVWTAYRARTLTIRTLLLDGILFSAPLWGWILFSLIYFGYALRTLTTPSSTRGSRRRSTSCKG
jgi:hypothetical protein